MESSSNIDDYSLSSSMDEEAESKNMEGIGRIYECVFCKRGFNTAQALGGHMNIHRKHKVTTNKPSTNVNHQINNHLLSETESSYVTYFPASTSTNNGHHNNNNNNIECLNLFGDDQWGLGFGNTAAAHDHVIQNIQKRGTQQDYLDLELRLGHHPFKQ